jgi:hypothetical protein
VGEGGFFGGRFRLPHVYITYFLGLVNVRNDVCVNLDWDK